MLLICYKLRIVRADVSSSSADDQNDSEVHTMAMIEPRAGPTDVLRDFQQYQILKRHHAAESGRHSSHPVDSRGTVVPGIAGQYAMRHGVQYYRDLAGNVKQVSCSWCYFWGCTGYPAPTKILTGAR